MTRKWLKVIFWMMKEIVSFGGSLMNHKELEDLLHIRNETKGRIHQARMNLQGRNDRFSSTLIG